MGNLINRLFSNDSRETGSKRPFSKHNKVSLNESNGKKSPGSQAKSHVAKQEVVESNPPSPLPDQPVNPEVSPFQRDFLPSLDSHQPLVSLEKSRPRRSNIRRSSRMNVSMGKGDNLARPGNHLLTSVPSIAGDEVFSDNQSNVISNRADPSLPVTHSAPKWTETETFEESLESKSESTNDESVVQSSVDELSPNERHKVAKSRISQMFFKREQQQAKHNSMVAETPAEDRLTSGTSLTSSGFVINTDYERVYETINNYGHYTMSDNRHQIEIDHHRPTPNVTEESESLHDQQKRVAHNDDDDEGHCEPEDESPKLEVVPRRKPKLHGNPLLIDELKKRQSTLYQTAAE